MLRPLRYHRATARPQASIIRARTFMWSPLQYWTSPAVRLRLQVHQLLYLIPYTLIFIGEIITAPAPLVLLIWNKIVNCWMNCSLYILRRDLPLEASDQDIRFSQQGFYVPRRLFLSALRTSTLRSQCFVPTCRMHVFLWRLAFLIPHKKLIVTRTLFRCRRNQRFFRSAMQRNLFHNLDSYFCPTFSISAEEMEQPFQLYTLNQYPQKLMTCREHIILRSSADMKQDKPQDSPHGRHRRIGQTLEEDHLHLFSLGSSVEHND